MYEYQRKLLEEARKINEAAVLTPQVTNKAIEDLNKRTSETLRKYRVPPNFTGNFAALRKRRDLLPPGARIMWGKDDSDLDVIPAHEVQKYLETGWVIIEGCMTLGDTEFVIVNENVQPEGEELTEGVAMDPNFDPNDSTYGPKVGRNYGYLLNRLKTEDRGGFLVLTRHNNSFDINYFRPTDINFAMTQTGFTKIEVGQTVHKNIQGTTVEHKIIAMKT